MVEQQIVPRLRQRFTLPAPPLCLRLTTFGTSESDLAAELDGMPLPPEVVLGYRSSSPIIELKLTGPESRRVEMEQAWRRVREVAGTTASLKAPPVAGDADAASESARAEAGVERAVQRRVDQSAAAERRGAAGGGELLPAHCIETLETTLARAVRWRN